MQGEGLWAQQPSPRPPTRPTLAAAFPDVDECLQQTDECRYNQICENIPGGHRCGCPRGYRVQGPGLPCLGTESHPLAETLVSTPSSQAGSHRNRDNT